MGMVPSKLKTKNRPEKKQKETGFISKHKQFFSQEL